MKKITRIIEVYGKSKEVTVWLDNKTVDLLLKYGDEALIKEYVKEEYIARCSERRETRRHVSMEAMAENGTDVEASVGNPLRDIIRMEDDEEQLRLKILTVQQRKVVILHVIEGMSFEEVAQEIGISKVRAWQLYQAAEKKLQEFFQTP